MTHKREQGGGLPLALNQSIKEGTKRCYAGQRDGFRNSSQLNYSNHLNTGLVWYLNGRFVSGIQMVVWKSLLMVENVQYSNGLPSHMTLPFEYRTPILSSFLMNLVFRCSVFRWWLYKKSLDMPEELLGYTGNPSWPEWWGQAWAVCPAWKRQNSGRSPWSENEVDTSHKTGIKIEIGF